MGTSRDSERQTGRDVLKILKNNKIHIFQILIVLLFETTCDGFI